MSNKGFTIVKNNLILDKNLTPTEKIMLITILGCDYKKTNSVTITYIQFMAAISTNRRSKVSDLIKSLINKGYISVKKKGNKRIYSIIKEYPPVEVLSPNSGTKKEFNSPKNETDENIISSITGTDNEKNNSSENETAEENQSFEYGTEENYNSSKNGTELSPKTGTHISNRNKNNKNNIYISIFDCWNSLSSNKESVLGNNIASVIAKVLVKYSQKEIMESIKNYFEVYKSNDHYYNFKWNLYSFLKKENGLPRFLVSGDIWMEYLQKKWKVSENYRILEQYID